jgi:hypothetical protein
MEGSSIGIRVYLKTEYKTIGPARQFEYPCYHFSYWAISDSVKLASLRRLFAVFWLRRSRFSDRVVRVVFVADSIPC